MKKIIILLIIINFLLFFFLGCTKKESEPIDVTIQYLQALVKKDIEKIITFSCKKWENDARMQVDSLMNVKADLDNVNCQKTSEYGNELQVTCQGIIKLTSCKILYPALEGQILGMTSAGE